MNQLPPYSQLRATLAIAKASLQSILRSPSAVVFSIAFPLVFVLVFGLLDNDGVRIDVGLHPDSDTATVSHQILKHTTYLNIEEGDTTLLFKELRKGSITAVIKVGKYNNQEIIEVVPSAAAIQSLPLLRSVLQGMVSGMNGKVLDHIKEHLANAQLNVPPTAFIKELSPINGRKYKMIDFILPGQLGFAVMSAGVFGTAFVFFSLRNTLVLKRFYATPLKRINIVLGEAISRVIFQSIGSTVLIVSGYFLFDFTLINGFSTFLLLLLLSIVGLIIFMGFGFIVSGISKSESSIPPIANIITLPQFLLAGTFFSISAFPPWLQVIAKVLPLTYLNTALRKVAFDGASLLAISSELTILAIWGVVVYILAARTFKWE